MHAISINAPRTDSLTHFLPTKRIAIARKHVAADPHRFADGMETAMTGLVFTGALLFAAGLLHIVAPAGAATTLAVNILRAVAYLAGAATLTSTCRAFFGR